DIWELPLQSKRVPRPWLATPADEVSPSFSSDGRFVAYRSNESGRYEVYVRPYETAGSRYQVSANGGRGPRWSPARREIFFVNRGSLWSAAVRTTPTFVAQAPTELFRIPEDILGGFDSYDVTKDGQRFVMVQRESFELRPFELVIVPNWVEELKDRVVAARVLGPS